MWYLSLSNLGSVSSTAWPAPQVLDWLFLSYLIIFYLILSYLILSYLILLLRLAIDFPSGGLERSELRVQTFEDVAHFYAKSFYGFVFQYMFSGSFSRALDVLEAL